MTSRPTLASDRRRRKTITALWMAVLSVGVILLIYWELTAILYILATLSVTALLIVVAVSDLAHSDKTASQLSPADDAPGVSNSVASSYGNTPSK
jgi:hypothetical protein